jgi:hypothetical protein
MALQSIPGYSGFRSGQFGQAYNEAAFRYFLDADRSRAERLRRPILLVLASLREAPGRSAQLTHATAAAMFAGLAAGLREVDFMGWYRQGHVAGAVLAQGISISRDQIVRVADRIDAAIKQHIQDDRGPIVHLRIVRLGGKGDC